MVQLYRYLQSARKTLSKKLDGSLAVEIAISPWTLLFTFVLFLIFIMFIYFGIIYLFFSITIMTGARDAAINEDVISVRDSIHDVVNDVLPSQRFGIDLFEPSDVLITPNDGNYVTVRAVYHVMLPGASLYQKLGGNPRDMIVPAPVKFSFYREY